MSDDEQSFTGWAAARQHALLRSAYLLTLDNGRAEDLVQEALVKVASRWARLRDQQPEAYARQVIYRDNVSWWRRHRRERLTDAPPERSVTGPGQLAESRLMLGAALARLTERQRAVLVMRYFDDLSEAETARLLGVAVGREEPDSRRAAQAARMRTRAGTAAGGDVVVSELDLRLALADLADQAESRDLAAASWRTARRRRQRRASAGAAAAVVWGPASPSGSVRAPGVGRRRRCLRWRAARTLLRPGPWGKPAGPRSPHRAATSPVRCTRGR